MAERAIYIIHRDRDKGVQLGLIWTDSALTTSEKQRLTRELNPEINDDAKQYMTLRNYMTEEKVVNILKRHGFVMSRDMDEVGFNDKVVTKMDKL